MKKISFFLFLLSALISKAQYPITITSGNTSTLQKSWGSYGGNLGYVFTGSFGDTTAANLSFIKNVPGQVIRVGDTLWMRNSATTKWLKQGGIGGVAQTLQQVFDAETGGSALTKNDTILMGQDTLHLSDGVLNLHSNYSTSTYPLIVENNAPGGYKVAKFVGDVAQVEIHSNAAEGTGYGSLIFFKNNSVKMSMGYDGPFDHAFMADVRNTPFATWEVEGTQIGGFWTGSKNFYFGVGSDRGQRVQVNGSARITDTLFYDKSIASASTSDSILVKDASTGSVKLRAQSDITGGGGSLPSLAQNHLYIGDASSAPVDAGSDFIYDNSSSALIMNSAGTNNLRFKVSGTYNWGLEHGADIGWYNYIINRYTWKHTGQGLTTLDPDPLISNSTIAFEVKKGTSLFPYIRIGNSGIANSSAAFTNSTDNGGIFEYTGGGLFSFYTGGSSTLAGAISSTGFIFPSSRYINFGTTSGSGGYGVRDNAGTMEVKNSGGSWTPIGSGGSSTYAGLTDVNLTSVANNDISAYDNATSKWVNKTPAQIRTILALATVATSGDYNDLSNKPSTPTINQVTTAGNATNNQVQFGGVSWTDGTNQRGALGTTTIVSTTVGLINLQYGATNTLGIRPASLSTGRTAIFPDADITVVGETNTATLSAKTLNAPIIGTSGTGGSAQIKTVGSVPTVSQTGAGSGGSVGVAVETGSTDHAGTITITTGNASVGSTGTVTLTFNQAYTGNTPVIVLTLVNGATAWGALATAKISTQSLSAPIITWTNSATGAAVALTANTTYKISYMVVGK